MIKGIVYNGDDNRINMLKTIINQVVAKVNHNNVITGTSSEPSVTQNAENGDVYVGWEVSFLLDNAGGLGTVLNKAITDGKYGLDITYERDLDDRLDYYTVILNGLRIGQEYTIKFKATLFNPGSLHMYHFNLFGFLFSDHPSPNVDDGQGSYHPIITILNEEFGEWYPYYMYQSLYRDTEWHDYECTFTATSNTMYMMCINGDKKNSSITTLQVKDLYCVQKHIGYTIKSLYMYLANTSSYMHTNWTELDLSGSAGGIQDVRVNGTSVVSGDTANIDLSGYITTNQKGSINGVASLDANGLIPSSQLPSYVDDVLEYASVSAFPATGEAGKIYVALDTNKTYRWGGSGYTEISASIALGETQGTAYEGNKGKSNADAIAALQSGKVDKETGKGLSTNDYTTTDKNKLANIAAGAEVNVQSDWNQTTTTADDYIKNKPSSMPASDVYSWAKAATKPTYTASEVGLGNVPNVATNDQTPTFTEASTRANITSGESVSTLFGKIKKFFSDLKTVAFTGSYNDLTNKPTIPTVPGVVSTSADGLAPRVTNTSYYLKGDGTWSTPPDTNNAVTQTASNGNSNYEILFSATADNTTRTEGARKSSGLTFNPSTGNLQATKFNGRTITNDPDDMDFANQIPDSTALYGWGRNWESTSISIANYGVFRFYRNKATNIKMVTIYESGTSTADYSTGVVVPVDYRPQFAGAYCSGFNNQFNATGTTVSKARYFTVGQDGKIYIFGSAYLGLYGTLVYI